MSSRLIHALILTLTFNVCGMAADTKSVVKESVPKDHVERAKKGLGVFKTKVRTILVKNCLECHGGKSTKADFDLSTRKALFASGFVEKTAADSHLVALITHVEEPHMPLKAPKLADKEIASIRQWIDFGAPYDRPLVDDPTTSRPAAMQVTEKDKEFWSFRRLNEKVQVPPVKNEKWCRTSVDRFVLAKQEAAGLTPNPVADRRTLIRRGYLDLIGLPPTPEEVDAFVDDPADLDKAWKKVVDRLLESPHFGERQARHWIDVARFGESFGYEQDYDRKNAYHYRDYLIRSFNQDVSWRQMIVEQLAGDTPWEKHKTTRSDAWLATGFMVGGAFPTQLTEDEFESARYDELDDMVSTTGVAFLGLSVGCARCHDHKFDPIPTVDYYRLASMFKRVVRSEVELDLTWENDRDTRLQQLAKWDSELKEVRNEYEKWTASVLVPRFRKWLSSKESVSDRSTWQQLKIITVQSSGGSKFERQTDGSWLAVGDAPAKEEITIIAETRQAGLRAIRLEALTDDSLPNRGPGRATNGNFALGDFRIRETVPGGMPEKPLKLVKPRATHQQNTSALSIAASIDDDPISGWAVDGQIGKDQAAVFETAEAFGSESDTSITITMTFNHPNSKHAIGRFRLSVSRNSNAAAEVGNPGPSPEVITALAALRENADESSTAWQTALDWFATTDEESVAKLNAVTRKKNSRPKPKLTKVMVGGEDLPKMPHHADGRGFPHFYPEVHLLNRGDVKQKGEVVRPGVLQVLNGDDLSDFDIGLANHDGTPRENVGRGSLAGWMTRSRGAGPLALRVMANRIWQHHFGRGIVSTPNDFGFTGERPTHPDLLEWLAVEMDNDGWKLKKLHRLIMTSSVYMQSGAHDETRAAKDRENQLLWRRAPRRLEGEVIRDSMLALSGMLDRTMLGPGTLDQNMKRRSVYFFIKRSKLIPMMMLFDWPEHLVSIGSRSSTTIAPQALMFLNSPQGRQYAEAFARRLSGKTNKDLVEDGINHAFGRSASQRETKLLSGFIEGQEVAHKEAGHKSPRQAALTDFCQTLFCMNEFVYVD